VVRLDPCPDCRLWRSYCLTHLRPTDANRCTCVRAPSPSAAPAHELWDGLFRDEIQCPHCHAVDYEHTDYPSGLRHDGDTAESGCAFCDKPMRVTLCAAYTYATEPLPAPASPRPEESEKTECPHGIDTLKTCGACPDAAPSPGATAPLTEERLAEWERIVHEWVPDDPDSRDRKVLALIAEVRRLRADEEGRAPYYLADGSTVMLPVAEVERLRKGAAKVIEAARRLSASLTIWHQNGATEAYSREHEALLVALDALVASPLPDAPLPDGRDAT
jgi:hypothetical protein